MPQTSITLPFADGVYTFRLGLAQINEVQNRAGDGIGAVFARMLKGRVFKMTPAGEMAFGDPLQAEYRIEDIIAVIRQGLMGGGKGKIDGQDVLVDTECANRLIQNYVLGDMPLKDSWTLAAAILMALIEGYDPPEDVAPASKKKRANDGRLNYGQALANCAMMGIGPEEAGRMDYWAYSALLWNWNEAHKTDDSPKPLSAAGSARLQRAMAAHAVP
jgi:hypothetical protein